ncbi:TPA: aminotransferase class I/II-fold pyridoxal phosphate-dependent enzyme [Streptococcus pneumoniae]|nr:aminotransferase class I/II-fold pyridoxal phosphate-dependent enzyme [Streptococcus pneumoniae]
MGKKEHGYYFDKEKLILLDSVMTGVANAIQAFTNLGDAVLINDPVYPPFKQIIENSGRKPVFSELEIKDGVYRFNFEKFEDCIITNKVKVFVLCNPHNPLGRAWEIAELNKIGNICLKYNTDFIT